MIDSILKMVSKDNTIFFVENVIPILTLFGAVVAALAAMYKYFNEKNREFHMNILKNVYAPLFEEIVKMEYCRKHLNKATETKKFKVKDSPFIELRGKRTNLKMELGKTSFNQEAYSVYNFEEKLKTILDDSLNYAPEDLVALIENYFFLEKMKGIPGFDDKAERTKMQRLIRKNVIVGYKKYRRKLGLKDVTIDRFCFSVWGFMFFR